MAMTEEYPAYLDEMEVGDERSLRARIDALTAELGVLSRALEDARRGKRILLIDGDDLTNEVVRFLHEDLAVDVTRKGRPGAGEELWLSDPDGPASALVLVGSSEDGNVTKHDVATAMLRRAQLGKDESTPLLMVVNTFRSSQHLLERDTPVPAEVVKRAAEDRILVARTIDLVRLGQRAANGFPAAAQLRDGLAAGGGWFEVDPSLTATTRAA
jgi:hypothetical protein